MDSKQELWEMFEEFINENDIRSGGDVGTAMIDDYGLFCLIRAACEIVGYKK